MSDETSAASPQASRGWSAWGSLSAVLLIVTAFVVAGAPREPDSVAHVRAFLTAIREGRVADALSLAGVRKPSGEQGRFLTRKALTDDWEIVALQESMHIDAYPSSPEEASVEVAIRAGGTTAVSELSLVKEDDRWRIENPLPEVTFPATSMLYVDVNGVRVPTEVVVSHESPKYQLLPGGYRFYSDVPDIAEVASKVVPILPGYTTAPTNPAPVVTLTRTGEQAARAALKKYIDGCVRSTRLAPRDCPFGADPGIGPQGEEYRSVSDFRDVSWDVQRYPDVAVISGWLRLADRHRGSIRVTVTATEDDTRKVRYSVTCEMRLNEYSLGITAAGTLKVLPPYARNPDREDLPLVDTCRP